MNLSDLNNLDFKDIARAPMPVKGVVLGVIFLIILGVGYYLDWSQGLTELETLRGEENSLRDAYTQKKRQAYHYETYKQRLKETEQGLSALLRQLPDKSEMDALLTDINQVGVGRGLDFDLFRPEVEAFSDFYATLPVTIKVSGGYHDIAGFISDLARLPRIVTAHNVGLTPDKDGRLSMDATLHTYRYLDENELSAQTAGAKKP
jgi:type IV pilus assembly protein PilO